MILDKDTSRPRNLHKTNLQNLDTGTPCFDPVPGRLTPPENPDFIETIRVPHSAVDLNTHVNNTEYVRFAMDALACAYPKDFSPKRLHVTYLAEVFENESINLLAADSDGKYEVLIRKSDDDVPVFCLRIHV
jgi:acyl-ACP thioesterase